MSISESLWIGASGLMSHGNAMSVVGDNIANASTIGFKRERASFNDLLGGEMVNHRVGGGSFLGKNQTMWQQGSIQQTGNGMDVAISGEGMFVVKGNHAGIDSTYYSRDGRFSTTNDGYLVDQQGLRVQGYTINADGTRNGTVGDLDLSGSMSKPVASTAAKIQMNLNSNAPVNATYDPANADSSTYHTSVQVTDSLGNKRAVDMRYVKIADGEWDVHAFADVGGTATEIGTGHLSFDTNGNLTTQTGTINANFPGASPLTIALDYTGTTQDAQDVASTNPQYGVVSTATVDGHGSGSLSSVQIDPDGKVEGTYDNGDKYVIAQIALAKIPNQDGLERMGDSLYSVTNESGQAVVDAPESGGRGELVAGALEQSNVDLGTELVTLIAYQRAFQANAKTVTTSDEMLQDINQLKR